MGAIVLKLAWRDASSFTAEQLGQYHTEDLLIYSPHYRNSTGQESCTLQTMAMVGMHTAHKTVKQPNWVWMTFEHTLNAPDCTSLPPTPDGKGAGVNENCPILASDAADFSFAPQECSAPGNTSCADCNLPPRSNAAVGECDNPFMDDGQVGWCLDQPPNPDQGTPNLCRQIPATIGHCSNDPQTGCTTDADCGDPTATCDGNYGDVNAWNEACLNAIKDASAAIDPNQPSVWSNYELIGVQWLAENFTSCQNNATDVAGGPNGPVMESMLRELVTIDLDDKGNPITRPFLGNTTMESYDRSNCLGCHAKSYLKGFCSINPSLSCTSDQDCEPNFGFCQDNGTVNTDFMYFLKLEVAEPPAVRLPGTRLTYLGHGATPPANASSSQRPRLFLHSASSRVTLGEPGSSRDPRCNGDLLGTEKARLQVASGDASGPALDIGLPCQLWRLVEQSDGSMAYVYTDPRRTAGPCRRVSIVDGNSISATCFGDNLPAGLVDGDGDGTRVDLVLSTGKLRYCTSHQSFQRFGELLSSRNDTPPDRCAVP